MMQGRLPAEVCSENTSETEELVRIEIYKSDGVADISLSKWLALTPADIVASTLKIDVGVEEGLRRRNSC